jgi:hypothetical protein
VSSPPCVHDTEAMKFVHKPVSGFRGFSEGGKEEKGKRVRVRVHVRVHVRVRKTKKENGKRVRARVCRVSSECVS